MKKWIEEILRKVLGELLGAERLSALAKKVLELLLADGDFVRAIAAKVEEIAGEQKAAAAPAPEAPETPED